jgi:hypothetical protein
VIFTDKTAVQLGGTRGKRRVWRLLGEAYNKKGPCHVWEKETPQEKRDRKVDLDARNALKEKADKQKW